MAILTRDNVTSFLPPQTYFNVRLPDDEFIRFVVSKNFTNIVTNEDIAFNLLKNCDIQTTKPGKNGIMNFKLLAENNNITHVVGFLNFYENDLNSVSSNDQIAETLKTLGAALDQISASDVKSPMTEDEASSFINNFLSEVASTPTASESSIAIAN